MSATTTAPETVFEESAKRVGELGEWLVEASRKTTSACVDAYEKTYKGIADYEQTVAAANQVEPFSTLLNAQAEFIREVGKATTASARELLK